MPYSLVTPDAVFTESPSHFSVKNIEPSLVNAISQGFFNPDMITIEPIPGVSPLSAIAAVGIITDAIAVAAKSIFILLNTFI